MSSLHSSDETVVRLTEAASLSLYYSGSAEPEWRHLASELAQMGGALPPPVQKELSSFLVHGNSVANSLAQVFHQGACSTSEIQQQAFVELLQAYRRLIPLERADLQRRLTKLSDLKAHPSANALFERASALYVENIERLARFESPALTSAPSNADKHIVVLLHGIRTEAAWAEMVRDVLRADPRLEVVTIRYGYFDLVRFLCPWKTRAAPVKRLDRELRQIRQINKTSPVSVVAHSFGAYAICELLMEQPTVELEGLILCGSVVKQDYRWDRLGQIKRKVINECGAKDIWPLVASAVTWGYGASGSFGFGTYKVHDRFHDFDHSDYFDPKFVKSYWLPYLSNGDILPTAFEATRQTPAFWRSLLRQMPIRWLLVAGVLFAGYLGILSFA
jgi:pimeloyl-ACP methyl ester carboxylesterase